MFIRFWRAGTDEPPHAGPVHVSMNDYLIHRFRDVPGVARAGIGFWRAWPRTEGALGLWVASSPGGLRQISVSVWRDRDSLWDFVKTPAHRRVMRDFRDAGVLHTNPWTAERLDRALIWRQAEERLLGHVAGVPHN
ncbi:MAG TPA: hypothetical protein VLM05_12580 [Mycobacteriales bacterium]|nr:hypothetical protein [Mycobacteriales bacterium]